MNNVRNISSLSIAPRFSADPESLSATIDIAADTTGFDRPRCVPSLLEVR